MPNFDPAVYDKMCEANRTAIEQITGKPMSTADQEKLGVMIYRLIQAKPKLFGVKANA